MYITLTSAAGLIVLVSTSALYVLTAWGSADRTVAAASLLFVLLAEIIFFAALVLLEAAGDKLANAAFVWSGQTILTGVYWIFTIIMAVINGYYYSDQAHPYFKDIPGQGAVEITENELLEQYLCFGGRQFKYAHIDTLMVPDGYEYMSLLSESDIGKLIKY